MSILGTRVVRTEDPRLLTEGGVYTDDLRIPELDGAARITFVRSPIAHARITGIDTETALDSPGVVAVLTAADMDDLPAGDGRPTTEPLLAADRVRYVGEAVAIVLTEQGYQGEDAAELVSVDYEPLPALISVHDAIEAGNEDYLDAVVKEALRIRPVIPGVGRVVSGGDFHFGGYVIPPGVEINPSIRTIHRRTDLTLEDLAEWLNPITAGWINYYGRFYRTALDPLLRRINVYLRRWAGKKFKRLRPYGQFKRWWTGVLEREPELFAQWKWVRSCWNG